MDAEPLAGVPVEGRQWIATTGWGPLGGIVYEATLQVPSGLILPKSVDGAETFPISSVAHLEQLPGGWRRRERQPLCRLAHRGGVARHGEAGQVGSLERRPQHDRQLRNLGLSVGDACGSKVAMSLYRTSAVGTPDGAPAGNAAVRVLSRELRRRLDLGHADHGRCDTGQDWDGLHRRERVQHRQGVRALPGDAIDASGNVDLSYVRVLQPNQTLVMFDQVP